MPFFLFMCEIRKPWIVQQACWGAIEKQTAIYVPEVWSDTVEHVVVNNDNTICFKMKNKER